MNFKDYESFTGERKLHNKFYISKLLNVLDVDFVYAYYPDEDIFRLLNESMFGTIPLDMIQEQVEDLRVVIVVPGAMRLYTYNIPESELDDAFMKLGGS